MLKWFHEFCKNNDIRYFAIGGTILGAVRHQGFIPWDDDIDIGMPRSDYIKLIDIMRKKTDSQYVLESPLQNIDFVYSYSKLYDTSTTLIENTRKGVKRGIYLDIFPLDGIGNSLKESVRNFKKIDFRNNLLSSRVCALNHRRKWYKNMAIVMFSCLPKFILSKEKLIKSIENLCLKNNYDSSKYVGNLVGNWHEKEIMPKECFGEPKLYKFENLEIFGPENYDAYLQNLYGDYMKLPPKEKQVSHHDYIKIDLNTSYLDN